VTLNLSYPLLSCNTKNTSSNVEGLWLVFSCIKLIKSLPEPLIKSGLPRVIDAVKSSPLQSVVSCVANHFPPCICNDKYKTELPLNVFHFCKKHYSIWVHLSHLKSSNRSTTKLKITSDSFVKEANMDVKVRLKGLFNLYENW